MKYFLHQGLLLSHDLAQLLKYCHMLLHATTLADISSGRCFYHKISLEWHFRRPWQQSPLSLNGLDDLPLFLGQNGIFGNKF
jgi:hypothetical protein